MRPSYPLTQFQWRPHNLLRHGRKLKSQKKLVPSTTKPPQLTWLSRRNAIPLPNPPPKAHTKLRKAPFPSSTQLPPAVVRNSPTTNPEATPDLAAPSQATSMAITKAISSLAFRATPRGIRPFTKLRRRRPTSSRTLRGKVFMEITSRKIS